MKTKDIRLNSLTCKLQQLSQQRDQILTKIKAARLEQTKLVKNDLQNQIRQQNNENMQLLQMKKALEKMVQS